MTQVPKRAGGEAASNAKIGTIYVLFIIKELSTKLLASFDDNDADSNVQTILHRQCCFLQFRRY
jgi:hypothetical protein